MSNRRCFALCLVLVMLILSFSACDQKSNEPVAASASPTTFSPLKVTGGNAIPSTASPQPNATSEPELLYNANDVTITMLSAADWSAAQKSSVNKLTKYLHKANWNIRFSLLTVPIDEDGYPAVMPYMHEELTSGGRLKDAYVVETGLSGKLAANGFLMNLTQILPETAPAYYSRCQALFEGDIYALPTHIVNQRGRGQEAFLSTGNENDGDASYQNISDVFTLLEKDATKSKKIIYSWLMGDLVNTWAFEQGYYPLSNYGMDGGVFAGYDDKNCAPVLVESIPGFADFADRCRALLGAHQLIPFEEAFNDSGITLKIDKEELLGFIRPIDSSVDLFPVNSYEGKTTAYPILAGRPRLPDDDPDYNQEIIIPADGGKAADVMKFVEWALLNSQNYDLVNYGEAGVDYQLMGDRYMPLINGVQAPAEQWQAGSDSKIYVNSFGSPFFNHQFARYQANAPTNIEDAKDKYQDQLPPIWSIEKFHKLEDYNPTFLELNRDSDFSTLINSRNGLLNGLFDPGSIDSVSTMLTKLSVLDNARMLEDYVQIIESFRTGE